MPSSFLLFAMSTMIIQIIYKLNPTPFVLGACDGVSTVGGGFRKAGFKGGGEVGLSFSNSLLINKYTKHKLTKIRCQNQRLIWRRSESYNVLLSYNENKN